MNARAIAIILLSTLLLVGFAQATDDAPEKNSNPKRPAVSFKSVVFPIIRKNCLPCHAEENFNPSDLHMDNYEIMMEGGKHGPPVEPGKPKESLLIQKLSPNPPFGDQMPLKTKTGLSDEEIKILSEWISQGAKKN